MNGTDVTQEDASQKQINRLRIFFSIFYFLLSISLVYFFRRNMFYFEVNEQSWNIHRFLWCGAAVSLGFAAIAFHWRHNPKTPLPEYLTHYPAQLVAMATLVFGVLHIFKATQGYLFYYLSFSLCFTFGYLVDSYWSFVFSLIEKGRKVAP